MDSLYKTIDTISHTIQDTWNDITASPPTPTLSRREVAFLEEQERARRVNSGSSSKISQDNAASVAALMKSVSFPHFKGNTSAGFKRITKQLEETERHRREITRPEASLRKMNANKTAGFIQSLGWPFYQQISGPQYILVDETSLLEEEEREYRIKNSAWALTAKNNAALISNLMRWEWDNAKYYALGLKRWSRGVEEKERTRRLSDKLGLERSIIIAYNTSSIIRNLGWPFFVQEEEQQVDLTWELEEKERKWRLSHPEEQQLARENAGKLFEGLVPTDKLEEKERSRRMEDFDEQYRAVAHAKQVSLLVSKDYSKIVEEERLYRLRNAQAERKNARRVAHLIDGLGITLSGIVYLEEKERKRRLHDVMWQAAAIDHAKQLSTLLGESFGAKNIETIEETERKDRMYNKAQQLTAIKNARFISRLIEDKPSTKLSTRSLEEQERSRRLSDRAEQEAHLSNARNISTLISGAFIPFDSSSLEEEERSRRLSDNFEQQLAQKNAAKVSSLVSSRLPVKPLPSIPVESAKPLPAIPIAKPLSSVPAASLPLEKSAPRTVPDDFASLSRTDVPLSQPTYMEPILPIPVAQDQFLSSPVAQDNFITAAPVTRVASVESIPTYVAPVAPATHTAPITKLQPSIPLNTPVYVPIPSSASAVRSAPIYSAPRSFTSYSSPTSMYSTVPATSMLPATGLQLHTLSATDRKKLEKQAAKHNKKAQKESKRATSNLAKAAKLHSRGKDGRAIKQETKAEQHTIAAKSHQLWANDLTKDAYAHPSFPLAPVSSIGSPTM